LASHRAVEILRYGPPDVLRVREFWPSPPGPSEVAVDTRAIGVNFADVIGRLGLYGPAPPAPYVPGFEVAGTVVAVGEGVTAVAVGDAVIAGARFGGYATHVVTPERLVMALPSGWSFEEGAGYFATYGTAYHALVTLGRLAKASVVLIHAAAGGLGTAATQLARHIGARVIGTAGGAGKARFCQEQGADRGIDYTRSDWPRRAREASGGGGFDLVLDSVLGPTFRHSLELLAPMGHLILCGAASFTPRRRRNRLVLLWKWLRLPRIDPLSFIPTNRTVSGFNLLLLLEREAVMRALASALAGLATSGAVRPVIDRVLPLEQAAEAHRHLQQRKSRGKVVLTI